MKKIKILFSVLVLVLFVTSCESYDDYDTSRPEVAGFQAPSKNLKVPNGGTKGLTLDIYVTDLSSQERTFTVSAVASLSQVDPENYQLDANFIIPANEHVGQFTMTGIDVSLTSEKEELVLQVDPKGDVISGSRIIIKMYK